MRRDDLSKRGAAKNSMLVNAVPCFRRSATGAVFEDCKRKEPKIMSSRVLVEEPASDSLSAYGKARSTVEGNPLTPEELRKTHAYWRACNYLALGMIYLQANPLLKEPLKPEHIKNRLL